MSRYQVEQVAFRLLRLAQESMDAGTALPANYGRRVDRASRYLKKTK